MNETHMDLFALTAFSLLFMAPSGVAFLNKKDKKFIILLLNVAAEILFLGYSFAFLPSAAMLPALVLWLVLLVWSMMKGNKITMKAVAIFLLLAGFLLAIYTRSIYNRNARSTEEYVQNINAQDDQIKYSICFCVLIMTGLVILIWLPKEKNKAGLSNNNSAESEKLETVKEAVKDEAYKAGKNTDA